MGICQHSPNPNKSIVYTTKQLLVKQSGPHSTIFYFSTESVSKLDCECLLVLSSNYKSISKNIFIEGIRKKSEGKKICSQFVKKVEGKKAIKGELYLYPVYGTTFQFQRVGVMCLNQSQFQSIPANNGIQQLKTKITENLQRIGKEGLKSLIITEFQWKKAENKLSIFSIIYQAILQLNYFKSIVFACADEKYQKIYMEHLQKNYKDKRNQQRTAYKTQQIKIDQSQVA